MHLNLRAAYEAFSTVGATPWADGAASELAATCQLYLGIDASA